MPDITIVFMGFINQQTSLGGTILSLGYIGIHQVGVMMVSLCESSRPQLEHSPGPMEAATMFELVKKGDFYGDWSNIKPGTRDFRVSLALTIEIIGVPNFDL